MRNGGLKGKRAPDGFGTISGLDRFVQTTGSYPAIKYFAVTDSSYNPYDDIAVTSGVTVVIYGSGFVSGCSVIVGTTTVTATVLDSNRLTFTAPALSNGTYVLYVINPNGSAAVLSPGILYSGFPTWSTSSSLSSSSSVSIQLAATGDTPLTYYIQPGTSLPSGLTLTSSGLLSGTTSVGVYSLVLLVDDAQLQTSQLNLTLTLSNSDPYFYETTLLLNGEAANVSYVADASTNNLPLTINGNANSNRFSPYWGNGYYGVSFDGSTGYISVPGAPFVFGTNPFTVEFWVFPTAAGEFAGGAVIIDNFVTGASYTVGQWQLEYTSTGGISFNVATSTSAAQTMSGGSSSVNAWTHFALVRTGTGTNQTTIYINGVSVVTGTFSQSIGANATSSIGRQTWNNNYYFQGYISNFRMLNGTALYTSNFTPSTSPLTPISNTTLLACQTPNFIDTGPSAWPLTPSSTVKVVPNQPFGTLPSTVTANTGYSTYFDGSTGYLSFPASGNFAQGSLFASGATFTVEAWLYQPTYISASYYNIVLGDASGSSGSSMCWSVGTDTSNRPVIAWYDGNSRFVNGTVALSLNTWNHVAWVVSAGVISIYVNGVAQTKSIGDTLTTPTQTVGMVIGVDRQHYFTGYISNLRVVKNVVVYTGAFTPPTSSLTTTQSTGTNIAAITGTSTVLLTCQGSTIADISNTNTITTNGTVKVLNNTYPFTMPTTTVPSVTSFGSGYFDGASGYLRTTTSSSAFTFGTGDFTIEFWVNWSQFANANGSEPGVFQTSTTSGGLQTTYTDGLLLLVSSGYYNVVCGTNFAGRLTSTSAPNFNTWDHVAIVRSSGTLTIYVNGVNKGSQSNTNNIIATYAAIGGYYSSSYLMNGYISNFRVVKGTAVYTSNFALPVAPLTPVANTSLLTLQNKQGAHNGVFYDDSVNNLAITRNGTPTQGTFTPFSPTGWSNYFDGSSYISTSNSTAFSGDFTVEAFVFPTSFANAQTIVGPGTNNSFDGLGINTNGTVFAHKDGVGSDLLSTDLVTLNQWNHIMWTRASNVERLWLNGIYQGQRTQSSSYYAFTQIGRMYYYSAGTTIQNIFGPGYISNLRQLTSALYSTNSNITVPTTPLTTSSQGATNCLMLTCQSNRFIDNSTNAFTLSISGTVQVQAFSPFAPGLAYSQATHGGSMYFNGSSDYLYNPSSPTSLNFGTGDFTIECWIYLAASQAATIIDTRTSDSLSALIFAISGSIKLQLIYSGSAAMISTTSVPTFSWAHVAVSRASGTIRMFINGVLDATTVSYSSAITPVGFISIGGGRSTGSNSVTGYYLNGYLSNLGVITGNAKYTANFTPPTAPPTPTANTSLLLYGTNAGIIDQSSRINIITAANTSISANVFKYGSGSVAFNGSTNYLSIPSNSLFGFGTADFTAECWIYVTNTADRGIFDWRLDNTTNTNTVGTLFIDSATNKLAFWNGTKYGSTGTVVSTNTWNHVALSRQSGNTRVYLNGVLDFSTATTFDFGTTKPLGIGGNYSTGSSPFSGYIDDVRITKGYARYTGNFTPPASGSLTQ